MAARTQEAYTDAVAELARYYDRSPAELGVGEVQAYLLHMIRVLSVKLREIPALA